MGNLYFEFVSMIKEIYIKKENKEIFVSSEITLGGEKKKTLSEGHELKEFLKKH
jgi:hypothetical protein